MTVLDSPRGSPGSIPPAPFDDFYMPAVYPMFLQVLHAISDQVWFSIAIQHLGGIAAGLIVFLAMRRLGLRPAIACVPTACILLAGDHLYLEHVFMADWLLLALAIAGLAAGVRGLVPAIDHRWLLAAGALLAAAGLTRSVGIVLPAVLALTALVCAAAPIRDRLLAAGAALAGAAAILAVYFGAFAISDGRYAGLTDFAGWNLYSRVAPFADCSRFDPPDGTEVLCEDVPPSDRPGPFGYVWVADSVSRANFDPLGPETGEPLGRFARQVILHQPLDYLEAVGEDFVRYFDPHAGTRPFAGQSPETISFAYRDPNAERNVIDALELRYDGVELNRAGERALGTYQAIFRVGGVVLLAAFVATVLGMFLARGALRLGTVLFGLSALALYLVPVITNSYDFRYGIPPGALIAISGILGACGMLVRYLPRSGARQCSSTRPRNCWVRSFCGLSSTCAGGPSSTTTPASMNTTLFATSRAKPISWVTTIIVIPSAASSRITSSTPLTSSGSSAEVTSSNSITCGSIASARAIATRCCWPPERRSGYSPSLSASPTRASSDSPFSRASAALRSSTFSWAMQTFSSAVLCGNRLKC